MKRMAGVTGKQIEWWNKPREEERLERKENDAIRKGSEAVYLRGRGRAGGGADVRHEVTTGCWRRRKEKGGGGGSHLAEAYMRAQYKIKAEEGTRSAGQVTAHILLVSSE